MGTLRLSDWKDVAFTVELGKAYLKTWHSNWNLNFLLCWLLSKVKSVGTGLLQKTNERVQRPCSKESTSSTIWKADIVPAVPLPLFSPYVGWQKSFSKNCVCLNSLPQVVKKKCLSKRRALHITKRAQWPLLYDSFFAPLQLGCHWEFLQSGLLMSITWGISTRFSWTFCWVCLMQRGSSRIVPEQPTLFLKLIILMTEQKWRVNYLEFAQVIKETWV